MKALRQFGFNAGEWDPRLVIRSDLDKFHYACTKLENFDIDAGGSISRRRGLELVKDYDAGTGMSVFDANAETMLFDGESKYVVVFLALKDTTGTRYETRAAVYNLAVNQFCGEFILHSGTAVALDLKSLRVKQSQDVLFVVHPAMPPKEILRDLNPAGSDYVFSARDFEFACPAMLSSEEHTHEIRFTPDTESDEFEIGCYTEGTLTATKLPAGIEIGDTIALECETAQTLYKDWGSETELKTSEAIPAIGKVSLETGGGRWAGELAIEASYDFGQTWSILSSVVAPDDGSLNPSTSVTIEDFGVWVRVRLLRRTKATYVKSVEDQNPVELDYGCKWWLKTEGTQTYFYKVNALVGNGSLDVSCLNGCPKNAVSKFYRLNAWSASKGYPMCVELAQERLWFLGNKSQPKTVWGSQINNLKNFCTGTLATSAVSFIPSANVYDRSIWFKWGHGVFMVGGTMSEMSMSSGSSGNSAITATSIAMDNQTTWGSANVDAVNAGDKLFYAKSGGEILNAQIYNFGSDSYASSAVNGLAKHLFSCGNVIRKIAYTRNPHSALFVLGEKGEIAKFVFSQEDNVAAWCRYKFAERLKCLSLTTIQEEQTDILACVMLDTKTGKCRIGKIDFKSDVWQDFGIDYDSTVVAMPMDISEGHVYGTRIIISGLDIYGHGIGDFEVSFDGGETYERQFAGFDVAGANIYHSGKIECVWNGDYSDLAQLAVRTRCRSEFTLYGYGADIKISKG